MHFDALVHCLARLALTTGENDPALALALHGRFEAAVGDFERRRECLAGLAGEHPELEARLVQQPSLLVAIEGNGGAGHRSKIP
jgi:hypothetical protein